MNPVELQGADVRVLISPSTGERIPVIAGRGLVFSAWRPSPQEMEKLTAGEPLWVIQRGTVVPEMTLLVATRREVIPNDLAMEAAARPQARIDEAAAKVHADAKARVDKAVRIGAWVIRLLVLAATGGILKLLLGLLH